MNKETLNVEFDVEQTINREYDYQEKILKFRGGETRYKGIVKEGKLVAILGRNYKLLPNETVESALDLIVGRHSLRKDFKKEGWKIFDSLWAATGDRWSSGAIVINSVDGTVALKCFAIINIHGTTGVMIGKAIQNVMRRHTKKSVTTIDGLEGEIGSIIEESQKYGAWLSKMGNVKAKSAVETLEALFDVLPNAYTKGVMTMQMYKTFSEPTLKDVYESVAKKIWSADTKMTTKLLYYKHLNDLMFVAVGF